MRKILTSCGVFIFFISVTPVRADTISQGVSKTTVESNVVTTGDAQVYKKLDVTVNGKREVIESHSAGSDRIEVSSKNGVTTSTRSTTLEQQMKVVPSVTKFITPMPTVDTQKLVDDTITHAQKLSLREWIQTTIADIFKKIFRL